MTIFLRADPQKLASGMRTLGPVLLALVGVAVLVVGREAIAGVILATAFAWYGSVRTKRQTANDGTGQALDGAHRRIGNGA